jgi:hypothetical protein
MHSHEEATIRAFVTPSRRTRWLESLASAKRRGRFLDRLNHCRDIDERYVTPLPSNADVLAILKSHGAPTTCYVVSADASLDARELPLAEALADAQSGGWGTLISCIPGRLACYYAECGERRMLLKRAVPGRRAARVPLPISASLLGARNHSRFPRPTPQNTVKDP